MIRTMIRNSRHLGLALLALSPLLASAALIDAGVTADKQTVQLDSERYQRNGDAVTAAIRISFAEVQRVPFSDKTYVTAERVYHFQCADKQFIAATGKMLDKAGAVVYEFDAAKNPFGAPKPQAVPEAGAEALAFAAACKYKK